MNQIHSVFVRQRRSSIPRFTAIALIALTWSSAAFCGEIHDAATNGDLEKVTALLKANPDLVFSKGDDDMTPLHVAAENGHKDVAQLLLANKADGNAKNDIAKTPLHYTALKDHADVAEVLLANKADVNAKANDGSTPLHWVAGKDVAELLLANKADGNAKAADGTTPLDQAVKNGNKDVVEMLRQHGGHE